MTGTVTAEDTGQPFAGVRVGVKGTLIATLTDSRGNFSLQVPVDATTLVFTFLGYDALEAPVADRVDVTLSRVAVAVEGVVVTALGVEREKQSLGYAVQDLDGEELRTVPAYNWVNTLHGKVAGLQITEGGTTGGSTRILIRGPGSIAGDNQPLIVVDGVPIDNSYAPNDGWGGWLYGNGLDYGNAAQDVDPADILTLSVLKGPNAAALYGSRAANGAILITTKSGRTAPRSGLGMTASISMSAQSPLRLPDYQNEYGQGFFGEFQWIDGAGGGLWDHVDESWGPRLDGRLIDQFTGSQQPWVAHPENVRSFFRTGQMLNMHVAVARASANAHVRLALTGNNVRGMAPGNTLQRWGLLLGGGADITDRLSASASLNYIDHSAENRPGTGYQPDNPLTSFGWLGRQVDMDALRNYRCSEESPTPCQAGGQFNWNYNYHNNPFWTALVNGNNDERGRVIGHVEASYRMTDWLTLSGRAGTDWHRDHRKRVVAPYSLDDAGDGSFSEQTLYRAETNLDLFANAARRVTPDLTVEVMAGGNIRKDSYEGSGVSVARLIAPGIYTIDNAAVPPAPWDEVSKREVRSLYGLVTLHYRDYLNVDLTGRNDWSSTLPADANSYFYPSVSAAFSFENAFGLRSSTFSSGKVRASWASVGSDAEPYLLTSVYGSEPDWGGQPLYSVPDMLANDALLPERTKSWEVGTDIGLFNQRLGFVLTYYDQRTVNQILGVEVSRASGYSTQFLNAGEIRNRGWELLATASPIRSSGGFHWDVTVNWSKNNSEVTALAGDLQTLVLGLGVAATIEARLGEPYGVIVGSDYVRDERGRLVLTESGLPQYDPETRVLGDYNPDWIGGIQNRLAYGPFELSVLVDGRLGGEILSGTNYVGQYSGVLESTLRGREQDFCDPGIVVDGVLPDGSVNGDGVNDVTACPQDFFHTVIPVAAASIYDASYVKLREVRLGIELPGAWARRLGFTSAHLALIGRNLALWSKAPNIDPETALDAGNVQGWEINQFPSARSLGFTLSLR